MKTPLTVEKLQDLFTQSEYGEILKIFNDDSYSHLHIHPNAQMTLAATYFQTENFTSCIKSLEGIEGAFSSDPHYFSLYGAALRRIGLKKEALCKFEMAINLSKKKDHRILNNYANLLLDMQKFSEAINIWEDIVKNNPSYHDAKINLEKARQSLSEFSPKQINYSKPASSVNSLEQATIDPLMAAFSDEEVLYQSRKVPNGTESSPLDKLLPIKTDNKNLMLGKVNLLQQCLEEKNYKLGLQLTSELRELGLPENLVYKYASDCHIGMKDYKEAEINLLHSLSLEPESINSMINLMSICTMKGDLQRASAIFKRLSQRSDFNEDHKKSLKLALDKRTNEIKSKKYLFAWEKQ